MKEDLNDCSWPKADIRECLLSAPTGLSAGVRPSVGLPSSDCDPRFADCGVAYEPAGLISHT